MSSRGTHSQRRFRRLPVPEQIAVATLAVVQLALLIWAQIDIRRRPDDQVIGPKLGWRLVCLINFVGPLSYLRWGRKREASRGVRIQASRAATSNS